MILNPTVINQRAPNAIVIRRDRRYTARTRRKNMNDVLTAASPENIAAIEKSALQPSTAEIDATTKRLVGLL